VLHYWISVALSLSLEASLIVYGVISRNVLKRVLALAMLAVAVASLVLHIFYKLPPGAAIPELISVFAICKSLTPLT